ncbi:MAG: hypothetical protein IH930_07615 [Proteobacteria bacterium]|nr:hypothetical protein [Pseudomonadota bacterium]
MTANTGYRLVFVGLILLIGLASLAGYVIISATMINPTFKSVAVVVFGSVMTIAALIFFTIVFFVRRKTT